MSERRPYTHAELEAMTRHVEARLAATEASHPAARPLPPLTLDETLDHLSGLIGLAGTRPLTPAEQFLMGQLHQQLRQATRAEMLGYRGRYYVLSEADLARLGEASEDDT